MKLVKEYDRLSLLNNLRQSKMKDWLHIDICSNEISMISRIISRILYACISISLTFQSLIKFFMGKIYISFLHADYFEVIFIN